MWRSLLGAVSIEIRCADIGAMLAKLTRWNITVSKIEYIDDLTVTLQVGRSDFRRLRLALGGMGCKISVKGLQGVYWRLKALMHRPVFIIGITLYLLFATVIPGRVYFVQIEGNQHLPDKLILEAAESCGLTFGANRRDVRSEKMKNALLEKIPELQWAGINTRGCIAIISVRERQEETKRVEPDAASIVAERDAIVRQITVLRGTPLCKVGQAVKAGQTLVSAYKDYGLSIKFTGTKAEIFGQTERNLTVVSPIFTLERTVETGQQQKYSVIIGKKQINFFKDSGILDASCVKMCRKTYLTLPGGYVLPVAWVTYVFTYYKTQNAERSDFAFVEKSATDYLMSQMSFGRILQAESDSTREEDRYCYFATYSCYESIGLIRDEELLKQNE